MLIEFSFIFQLGIGGLLFIASLTDHCCHLIVKTKYHAIRKVSKLHMANVNRDENENPKKNRESKYTASFHSRKYSLMSSDEESDKCSLVDKNSYSSDDEDEEYVIYDIDEVSVMEQHMMKHMSYGDIGRLSFGRAGTFIVNLCIVLTQFGFCVAYFIFIGNTLYSMFPYHVCVNYIANNTSGNVTESNSTTLVPLCRNMYVDLVPSSRDHNRNKTTHRTKRVANMNEDTFLSTTMTPLYNPDNESTALFSTTSSITNFSTDIPYIGTTTQKTVVTTTNENATTTTLSTPTPTPTTEETTTSAPHAGIDWDDISTKILTKNAPSLKLLVASPLPLFILFAFIRTVRKLGFISVLANTAILIGCISVFIYVLVGELI